MAGEIPVLQILVLFLAPWGIRMSKVPASLPGVLDHFGVRVPGLRVQRVLPFVRERFSVSVVQTGYGEPSLLSGVQWSGLPGRWDGFVVLRRY